MSTGKNSVLFIHPQYSLNDLVVPCGLIGTFNAVGEPKIGRFEFEVTEEEIKTARVICIDLLWYFPLASVIQLARNIKSVNSDARIVLGGITAALYADLLTKKHGIDHVITWNGEAALPLLIDRILRGKDTQDIREACAGDLDTALYDSLDYINIEWFPTYGKLARQITAKHRENRNLTHVDGCHPVVPLARLCNAGCHFCYGAYKTIYQGAEQVISRTALERHLEVISKDPDYEFVNFASLGLASREHFDHYLTVFSRKWPLDATFVFCLPPSLAQTRQLQESFSNVLFHFTNPYDNPRLYQQQNLNIDEVATELIETLDFLDRRDNTQVKLSYIDPKKASYINRVKKYNFSKLQVSDNAVWHLIRPIAPVEYTPEDKRKQFSYFEKVSSAYRNFYVLCTIYPVFKEAFNQLGLYPISQIRDFQGGPDKQEFAPYEKVLKPMQSSIDKTYLPQVEKISFRGILRSGEHEELGTAAAEQKQLLNGTTLSFHFELSRSCSGSTWLYIAPEITFRSSEPIDFEKERIPLRKFELRFPSLAGGDKVEISVFLNSSSLEIEARNAGGVFYPG